MNNSLLQAGMNGYWRFTWLADHLRSAVLLLFRLAWGWELVESGYGHLSHPQKTLEFFTSLGIPFPTVNVYLSGGTELVGGGLLMLGLLSRVISVPLVINFCVAYLTASRDTVVHLFSQDPSHFVDDTAFPFLMMSLLILAFGPGKLSIDYLLRGKRSAAKFCPQCGGTLVGGSWKPGKTDGAT